MTPFLSRFVLIQCNNLIIVLCKTNTMYLWMKKSTDDIKQSLYDLEVYFDDCTIRNRCDVQQAKGKDRCDVQQAKGKDEGNVKGVSSQARLFGHAKV